MFNSQKINSDPAPYYVVENDTRYTKDEIDAASILHPPADIIYQLAELAPRPEYDNNPNPILEYFRNALASSECKVTTLATIWESLMDTGYDWENGGLTPTPEHITHARKMLERLANFGNN